MKAPTKTDEPQAHQLPKQTTTPTTNSNYTFTHNTNVNQSAQSLSHYARHGSNPSITTGTSDTVHNRRIIWPVTMPVPGIAPEPDALQSLVFQSHISLPNGVCSRCESFDGPLLPYATSTPPLSAPKGAPQAFARPNRSAWYPFPQRFSEQTTRSAQTVTATTGPKVPSTGLPIVVQSEGLCPRDDLYSRAHLHCIPPRPLECPPCVAQPSHLPIGPLSLRLPDLTGGLQPFKPEMGYINNPNSNIDTNPVNSGRRLPVWTPGGRSEAYNPPTPVPLLPSHVQTTLDCGCPSNSSRTSRHVPNITQGSRHSRPIRESWAPGRFGPMTRHLSPRPSEGVRYGSSQILVTTKSRASMEGQIQPRGSFQWNESPPPTQSTDPCPVCLGSLSRLLPPYQGTHLLEHSVPRSLPDRDSGYESSEAPRLVTSDEPVDQWYISGSLSDTISQSVSSNDLLNPYEALKKTSDTIAPSQTAYPLASLATAPALLDRRWIPRRHSPLKPSPLRTPHIHLSGPRGLLRAPPSLPTGSNDRVNKHNNVTLGALGMNSSTQAPGGSSVSTCDSLDPWYWRDARRMLLARKLLRRRRSRLHRSAAALGLHCLTPGILSYPLNAVLVDSTDDWRLRLDEEEPVTTVKHPPDPIKHVYPTQTTRSNRSSTAPSLPPASLVTSESPSFVPNPQLLLDIGTESNDLLPLQARSPVSDTTRSGTSSLSRVDSMESGTHGLGQLDLTPVGTHQKSTEKIPGTVERTSAGSNNSSTSRWSRGGFEAAPLLPVDAPMLTHSNTHAALPWVRLLLCSIVVASFIVFTRVVVVTNLNSTSPTVHEESGYGLSSTTLNVPVTIRPGPKHPQKTGTPGRHPSTPLSPFSPDARSSFRGQYWYTLLSLMEDVLVYSASPENRLREGVWSDDHMNSLLQALEFGARRQRQVETERLRLEGPANIDSVLPHTEHASDAPSEGPSLQLPDPEELRRRLLLAIDHEWKKHPLCLSNFEVFDSPRKTHHHPSYRSAPLNLSSAVPSTSTHHNNDPRSNLDSTRATDSIIYPDGSHSFQSRAPRRRTSSVASSPAESLRQMSSTIAANADREHPSDLRWGHRKLSPVQPLETTYDNGTLSDSIDNSAHGGSVDERPDFVFYDDTFASDFSDAEYLEGAPSSIVSTCCLKSPDAVMLIQKNRTDDVTNASGQGSRESASHTTIGSMGTRTSDLESGSFGPGPAYSEGASGWCFRNVMHLQMSSNFSLQPGIHCSDHCTLPDSWKIPRLFADTTSDERFRSEGNVSAKSRIVLPPIYEDMTTEWSCGASASSTDGIDKGGEEGSWSLYHCDSVHGAMRDATGEIPDFDDPFAGLGYFWEPKIDVLTKPLHSISGSTATAVARTETSEERMNTTFTDDPPSKAHWIGSSSVVFIQYIKRWLCWVHGVRVATLPVVQSQSPGIISSSPSPRAVAVNHSSIPPTSMLKPQLHPFDSSICDDLGPGRAFELITGVGGGTSEVKAIKAWGFASQRPAGRCPKNTSAMIAGAAQIRHWIWRQKLLMALRAESPSRTAERGANGVVLNDHVSGFFHLLGPHEDLPESGSAHEVALWRFLSSRDNGRSQYTLN